MLQLSVSLKVAVLQAQELFAIPLMVRLLDP